MKKKVECILGLDISSRSTGWAILKSTQLENYIRIPYAEWLTGTITTDSKHGYGRRLDTFNTEISSLISKHKPSAIVIEEIFRGPSIKTFKTLSYFHGVAHLACWTKAKFEPSLMHITRCRKLVGGALGKKIQSKEDAFGAIVDAYGCHDFTFNKDNDRTDAMALIVAHLAEKEGVE